MWIYPLGFLNLVLLIATISLARSYAALRRRVKRKALDSNEDKWPVPSILADRLAPAFELGEWGFKKNTETHFIGLGNMPVIGTISDYEAWILSVLAKSSQNIFEFGTCTGRTTYLMARNSPEDTKVTTLTLGPDQLADYVDNNTDSETARKTAISESHFEKFFYTGTDTEAKITQLFNDSKAFDESPYHQQCDLIFIDGSHAYSYVVSDTKKAFRMIKPGGIILWHDYRGPIKEETLDVYKALNKLLPFLPLRHVSGTALVTYTHDQAHQEALDKALEAWT